MISAPTSVCVRYSSVLDTTPSGAVVVTSRDCTTVCGPHTIGHIHSVYLTVELADADGVGVGVSAAYAAGVNVKAAARAAAARVNVRFMCLLLVRVLPRTA
jgi:hypothetical protein